MKLAAPTARDLVSRYSVTLSPDAQVLEAVNTLARKKVAGAPVVDGRGKLVGVLTEKDCLRVLSHTTWDEVAGGRVADFMSELSKIVDADMDVFEVAAAFLDTHFPVLPVLDAEMLVGRVTRQDVLHRMNAFNRKLETLRERREEQLRRQSPDSPELEALAAPMSQRQLYELLARA
ncbi:MAG TPA: CBS domain-containing protein [Thermoanaerobaculia bacterium]|nr:CBS domain-containing protein [Thermoanaerobaculia bacterium]